MTISDFERIKTEYTAEQVLRYFGVELTGSGKFLCPVHPETEPSAQLYDNGGYCYGCKAHWDVVALAKVYLSKEEEREVGYGEVLGWFDRTELPAKSPTKYETSSYNGPPPKEFIDYWHQQMTDEKYEELHRQRLITKDTAQRYKLGWRPDWQAWTIPFWRGEPGASEVDVVQFRMPDGSQSKYMGLKGHNRGSVQNAHLLDTPQPYVVILFGAYDAILALQDGVIAVGLNGSMPFKKTEMMRVRELFAKQDNIYVLPDNTESEVKSAYVFENWLGARVRYFPPDSPPGCDYIDYRKLGHDAFDFRQSVLCLQMSKELIENVGCLLNVGDPYRLAPYHALFAARTSHSPSLVAQDVLLSGPLTFSDEQWRKIVSPLTAVESEDDLFAGMNKVSEIAYQMKGGW